MLTCEGYKMFKGTMSVTYRNIHTGFEKREYVQGTWLYKPEYKCWYCNGSSYPEECCEVFEDETN